MQAQVLFFGRCPIQVGHHPKCSGGYTDRAFEHKKSSGGYIVFGRREWGFTVRRTLGRLRDPPFFRDYPIQVGRKPEPSCAVSGIDCAQPEA